MVLRRKRKTGIWNYKEIGGTEYTFYTGGHMIASTLEYNSESGKYFLHDESGKKIDVSREGWYKVTYEGEAIWYYFKDGKPYDGMLGNYFLSYGRMITGIYGTSKAYTCLIRTEFFRKMAGNYMTAAGIMQEQPEDYTQVSIESVE